MEYQYIKKNKLLIIPEGVTEIPDYAFFDNDEINEVILPSTIEYIGHSAFKNCRNLKKINIPKNVSWINDSAFEGCQNLEEISLPKLVQLLSNSVFRNCTNLKKIELNEGLKHIDDFALFGCSNLEEIIIPEAVTGIGIMALSGCETIQEIHIPKNVEKIDIAALAYTKSLRKITVDKDNKNYISDEDDTLIQKDGIIIQYATASPKEEYIVGYYNDQLSYNDEDHETQSLTYNIGDYAFAGAKNLKRIYINSELESIASHTFEDCNNLKILRIFHTPYGSNLIIHVYKSQEEKSHIPFETITIDEGITTLCSNLKDLFKNAKEVNLPSTLESINEDVFNESKNLRYLKLPKRIKSISPNTFNSNTTLSFFDAKDLPAESFNMLQTKTSLDYYLRSKDKGNIRIFSLKNGTYYIKYDDYDLIVITKDEIGKLSNTSKKLEDEPDTIIEYIINLLSINNENHTLLTNVWLNKELQDLFEKFINDFETSKQLASKKIAESINDIIKRSGVTDEFLFSSILIKGIGKEDLIKLLENYNESISRYFRLSKSLDEEHELQIDKLIQFSKLLEKYKRYDRFLYNPALYESTEEIDQELLLKHYNKNIKTLLQNSKTLSDTYGNNTKDLLRLCNALGVFSDNERLSQKMATFINEKMFTRKDGKNITGNTIHTMFSDINPREEIDYEFIEFFIDNYDKLIEEEKKTTGIISRIYNSFKEISKTSTSHRGEQRHLKVTLDKCLNFFIADHFKGVTKENKKLACHLQKFYSEQDALKIGEMIINQCKDSPRNIFGEKDLREKNKNDFSYEWLPKQDYDNLILGKYCSCCAHLLGAGAGIMRASMITDNCQNLVIRNEEGTIIAKMTIYVNKEEGYAVYNTAEININYRDENNLRKIYNAFIRGTNAFLEEYNKNNIKPITLITIGEYRNTLKDILGNKQTPLLETPNYSNYSYYRGNTPIGTYDGDGKKGQILVYKK